MKEAEAERVKKEAASGVILSSVEDEGESSTEPAELGMKWMKQVTTA